MRVNELFDPSIDEVSMSPGALADFAKTEFAQNMTAGFEAELIVPNAASDDNGEYEPDFDQDERVSNTNSIRRFFLGGDMGPSRRAIDNAIEKLEEEFYEYADEKMAEEWLEIKDKIIKMKMKDDELTDEEIADSFENEDRTYRKYEEDALDEFRDDYDFDQHWDDFIDDQYPYMTDIMRGFDLEWPHWTQGVGEGRGVQEIASEIEDAIGMRVKGSDSYHGVKRGTDFFILEPDSSINSDDGEAGLELVSPPMPLMQCLEFLDKVFDWAKKEGCYTDKSTGFHMGVSIPGQTMENVDHLKFILFLGDEYVLSQFGRSNNSYAKSMVKRIISQTKSMQNSGTDVTKIMDAFRQGMNSSAANFMKRLLTTTNDRYVTVNIKEKYIEVRSAGGNYLEDLPKIKNTLLRYVRVMGLAADPEAEKQEYAKKFYKLLLSIMPEEENTLKYFAQYSAGTLPATALKSFVRNIQQKRAEKKNPPQAATVGGTIPYKVIRRYDRFKVHQFLARDPAHALELLKIWARNNGEDPRYYSVGPIQDETEPNRSSAATAGTYIIQYQDPSGAEYTTALDANSAREAEEWFTANHPSSYRIIDTRIA